MKEVMNDKTLESLSSFMDGENKHFQLEHAEELRQKWNNYHLIGDTLRNNTPHNLKLNLADKIQKQITDEALILAPRNLKKPTLFQRIPLSIAASVAVVAVAGGVALIQLSHSDSPSAYAELASVQSLKTQIVTKNGHEIERLTVATQKRLKMNSYLAQHGAAALTQGDFSRPLRARVVTYPE